MNLYTKEGWLDWNSIMEKSKPFLFITGGRGIGKTYGCIEWFLDHRIPFLYMRRTQVESELQQDPQTCDLEKNFQARGIEAAYEKLAKGKICRIYNKETEELIAETIALSTFASVRSVNFSEFDFIVYDEFIPEPHVKAIKMEGFALSQVYESVNRNRELQQRNALRMICLSNSLNIANDVFMQFGLIDKAEEMSRNETEVYSDKTKTLIVCKKSPISRRKSNTILYQTASEEFARMAIKNDFVLNDFSYVIRRPLSEYNISFNVGDLYIYKHKVRPEWYVTFTKATTKNKYGANKNDLERMRRERWHFLNRYLDGDVRFDSYKAVALLEKYFA